MEALPLTKAASSFSGANFRQQLYNKPVFGKVLRFFD
jgi:hypothetical protein